jgi:hypothetical protein
MRQAIHNIGIADKQADWSPDGHKLAFPEG